MTNVYTDADYLSAHKQKSRIFWFFIGITVLYALFCGILVSYHASLPYGTDSPLAKACVYVATVIYAVFAYVYLSIKHARVRRYCKMLDNVNEGMKTSERNFFYEYRKPTLQKDNVDVVTCLFGVWSNRKQQWTEREVYYDAEKELPPFENGDLVRYVTQGNVMVQYEILQKGALEFHEEATTEEE